MAKKRPAAIDKSWFVSALKRADEILAKPPAKRHIIRTPGVGKLVARFVLPLELCQPQNRTRHGQPWALAKIKTDVQLFLMAQAKPRKTPLDGRPFVRCIRFSSVEPDKYNDGFKFAVDKLCAKPGGLSFLRDDRPADCDLHMWWEYSPPKGGFGLIEIYSGDADWEAA